jgi:hypothetical protein
MRKTLASLLVASAAALTLGGLATPASAVCGGGGPGEPCYCPNTIKVGKEEITLFYC